MEMPRWTIAELLTRYELEPTLTDVFVEGQFDKEILMCAYDHVPRAKRTMYTADVIDISKETFEKHKLTKGNKQKLIVLCRELSEVNLHENVRFIVDRDTDHWFGELENGRGLRWTDFCDIEAYFFEEEFVRELIVNAGKAKIENWMVFYESFHNALKAAFSIRAAAREAGLYLNYLDFERFASNDNGRICFDLDTYIERTLHKSKLFEHDEKIRKSSREWLQRFKGDPRLCCRGHDFVVLTAWSIMKYNGVKSLSNEAISRILVLLVPRDPHRFSSLL